MCHRVYTSKDKGIIMAKRNYKIGIGIRYLCMICATMFSLVGVSQHSCPLIPAPSESTLSAGSFCLTANTRIIGKEHHELVAAQYLQEGMLKLVGLPLSQSDRQDDGHPQIVIHMEAGFPKEGYRLSIQPKKIVIAASDQGGLVNGSSSLIQLVKIQHAKNRDIRLPCWDIKDHPSYGWRGLMLDVSRHFIAKEKLIDMMDWMALYKLNHLHLHLSDEPAWRLEIQKYPKLALIGGVGSFSDPQKPAAWYSQQDIRELVNYAAKRNIAVVPEIDMPGHATASNRAYPQFSGGGSEKYPDFTFDPGNEDTYAFLAAILRETNALFPARMLHLGGDEVSFGSEKWDTNVGIKRLMDEENLSDSKAVERYFMERMADTVFALGSQFLAWDEMAEVHLPKEHTIIFWWRHDRPEQLEKSLANGYKTVLCPRLPLYFDFVQDSTHDAGRKWDGHFNALRDVYIFNPKELIVNPQKMDLVLGMQANLWAETITYPQRLDYLLFPRVAALAEAAWSDDRVKDFESFSRRVKPHLELYRQKGMYFYDPFDPSRIPEPKYFKEEGDRLPIEFKD